MIQVIQERIHRNNHSGDEERAGRKQNGLAI